LTDLAPAPSLLTLSLRQETLHCAILTLFPAAIRPYLDESILGIAQAQGKLRVDLVDFRNFAYDPHRTVDDRPFGGGPGMVLKPEPIFDAIEDVERAHGAVPQDPALPPRSHVRPAARARTQPVGAAAVRLCGRYEGYDERIRSGFAWEEISLGDFVLAGGELAALVRAGSRGALDSRACSVAPNRRSRSRSKANCSTTRVYTRPREFRGMAVPEILLSGDHRAVAAWRRRASTA
jgi:tRNA (guanine37-N1)-methyltransferase